ncbi:hypothetical protein FNH22_14490 [Fulvivirga sp. M361]|uniref:hypothetical protein n=1 Tax=Fulvivirga sp. M361 TaxID=2594266 RepID=UPI00117AD7F6|nr:hypothetical protein [Fulvivirga sp. M361]TRX58263.1 hypothetical protein FNH22_14490 [Fulvivirga sp. M361]
MKKIQLSVTVEEGNLIFKGLSKLPFEEVYELIGKLNEQANHQLRDGSGSDQKNLRDKLDNFLDQ